MIKPSKVVEVKHYSLQFSELLEKHPELSVFLISINPPKFNLGNPLVLSALNKTLFEEILDLKISVPKDYLIPSFGLRHAFCDLTIQEISEDKDIIEIGTGASASIALILAKKYGKTVIATEINQNSFDSAKMNIKLNNLTGKISLLKSKGELITDIIPPGKYSAVICYPPTYSNDLTILNKRRGWKGIKSELIGGGTDGLDFVISLLSETLFSKNYDINVISLLLLDHIQVESIIKTFEEKMEYKIILLKSGTRERFILFIRKKNE